MFMQFSISADFWKTLCIDTSGSPEERARDSLVVLSCYDVGEQASAS